MKTFKNYITEDDISLDAVNKAAGIKSNSTTPTLISGNGIRYIINFAGKKYALDFLPVGKSSNRAYRSDLHLLSVKDNPDHPVSISTKLGMSSSSNKIEQLLDDAFKFIKAFTNFKKPLFIYFMPVAKKTEFASSTNLHSRIFDSLHDMLKDKKDNIGNYKISRGTRDKIDDDILGKDLGFSFKMIRGGGSDVIKGKSNLPKFD